MQRKAPPRSSKPTFSPAIPKVAKSDDTSTVPVDTVKVVERLQAALDEAKNPKP